MKRHAILEVGKVYKNRGGGASWYFYGKDRRFNRRASKSTLWNSEAEVIGNRWDNRELLNEN